MTRMLCVACVLFGMVGFYSNPTCGQMMTEIPDCFTEYEKEIYRQRWLQAEPILGRNKIVEEIGEEGARRMARSKGWEQILRKGDKTSGHAQGFDQVWKSKDGKIHVLEAKGGISPLGHGYGYRQGTPEWAVKAGEATLKNHAATEVEKEAARRVLKAASEGKLNVDVIRTPHVQGKPSLPTWESMNKSTPQSISLANDYFRAMRTTTTASTGAKASPRSPVVEKSVAQSVLKALPKGTTLVKCAGATGVVVDGAIRVHHAMEVEKQFQAGEIDHHQRVKAHVQNGASAVGGWSGAAAGSYAGTMAGAAVGSIVPGPGTAIGGFIGGLVGGIGGYLGGEAVAEATVEVCIE